MLAHKKITKSGGITIPQLLRHELGISAGTAVDIVADEDGLHITKHVPTCFHCGTVDGVITRIGIEICRKCSDEIRKGFDENGNS